MPRINSNEDLAASVPSMMSEAYDQIQPEPSMLSGLSNSKIGGGLLAATMKEQMSQMVNIMKSEEKN